MAAVTKGHPPVPTPSQLLNDAVLDVWLSFRTGSGKSSRNDECLYFANASSASAPRGTVTPRDALPKQTAGTVRLVCVSDTHGRHSALGRLPDGDLMVHCGDILMSSRLWSSPGKRDKYHEFNEWLGGPACAHIPHRVVIGGNHDAELELIGREAASDLLSNGTYLQNEATIIDVGTGESRVRVRVFGSPSSHGTSNNRGFQHPQVAEAAKDTIMAMSNDGGEEFVDVLLTHACSPRIREAYSAAGLGLAAHVWGHDHGAYGVRRDERPQLTSACASIMDQRYRPVNLPIVIDLGL